METKENENEENGKTGEWMSEKASQVERELINGRERRLKKRTTGQEGKEEEKGSKPRKQGSMEVEEHGLNNEQSHILSR